MARTIFAQPDPESVWAQHRRVVEHLTELGMYTATGHLDGAGAEILAFTGFPEASWRQVWSDNPQERLDKETRRHQRRRDLLHPRLDHPPRRCSAGRTTHDEWAITRRYMSAHSLAQARIRLLEPEPRQLTKQRGRTPNPNQLEQNPTTGATRNPPIHHIAGRDLQEIDA